MPTDRISPSSSLLETLRAMARDRAKRTSTGTGVSRTTADGIAQVPPQRSVKSLDALRRRLRDTVANVNVDDASILAEARKPVLREILLWEFGSDFRKDAQFLPMVDAIAQSLEVNPDFAQRFSELVAVLRDRGR